MAGAGERPADRQEHLCRFSTRYDGYRRSWTTADALSRFESLQTLESSDAKIGRRLWKLSLVIKCEHVYARPGFAGAPPAGRFARPQ